MIATRLTVGVADLGRATKFARHDDHHAAIEPPLVDFLDERAHRLIEIRRAGLHGVEDVM